MGEELIQNQEFMKRDMDQIFGLIDQLSLIDSRSSLGLI